MSDDPLSVSDVLTIAWMDGYHKRDAEIERLREGLRARGLNLQSKAAEIERLRKMLDDILAEVELPQSIESRVSEALGDE